MGNRTDLSVFLSYSRNDLAIATQLIFSLEAFGFNVTVDHEGIKGGERWRDRLRHLILEADSVIFVLSPASAASDECKREVETALSLSKRIVPALIAPLGKADPPGPMRDLNYVYFYPDPAVPDSGFGKGLGILVDALTQDLDWVRDHTRLIEIAERWNTGRPVDLLLRGTELAAFRDWRRNRPASAPVLTPLQTEFLNASEAKEREDQDAERRQIKQMQDALEAEAEAQEARVAATKRLVRRTYAGIVAGVILTSLAVWQAVVATEQRNRAEEQTKIALNALEQTKFEQTLQDRMLDLAANRDPPDTLEVHVLASRYEGQKSDHVASEFGVGHFYGIYRIRAGPDQANMQEFLAFLRKARQRRIAKVLEGAGGLDAANRADEAFVAAWRDLANGPDKDLFERLQHGFVRNTDYGRFINRLDNARDDTTPGIGLRVMDRSIALQAVMFSIVVQYGPTASGELILAATDGIADPAALSDAELIELLYQERDRVERYFPKIVEASTRYADLIRLRNLWEKRDALYMLQAG